MIEEYVTDSIGQIYPTQSQVAMGLARAKEDLSYQDDESIREQLTELAESVLLSKMPPNRIDVANLAMYTAEVLRRTSS